MVLFDRVIHAAVNDVNQYVRTLDMAQKLVAESDTCVSALDDVLSRLGATLKRGAGIAAVEEALTAS